jgi:hypothetical protein
MFGTGRVLALKLQTSFRAIASGKSGLKSDQAVEHRL